MRRIGLLIFSLGIVNISLAQEYPVTAVFGKQFIDSIKLPSKYNYIISAKLYPLNHRNSKKYYNDPTFNSALDSCGVKNIMVVNKKENLNMILIPPLKPNKYYSLNVKYIDKYNIYGMFREMHDEKLKAFDEGSNWIETLKSINNDIHNSNNLPFAYYYQPTNKDLQELKSKISEINFYGKFDTSKVEQIVYNEFKSLNFNKKNITKKQIIEFCKWLMKPKVYDAATGTIIFDYFGLIPDYLRLYDFYKKYLERELDNNPNKYLTACSFEKLVNESIDREKKFLRTQLEESEPLPNFLNFIDSAKQYSNPIRFSTYTEKYETSYKRSLVPDFGYIFYIPYSGSITGGSPYVGVHISLSPVNKDVPLVLSKLSFCQRFSIHTGVTLNSLKKEGYRNDFFSNYSLLFGGGCKILTQSTRLNFGGVLFKKIDAVTGNSSLAIQPYFGLSIDIEIKKWLESIIPFATKSFNSN